MRLPYRKIDLKCHQARNVARFHPKQPRSGLSPGPSWCSARYWHSFCPLHCPGPQLVRNDFSVPIIQYDSQISLRIRPQNFDLFLWSVIVEPYSRYNECHFDMSPTQILTFLTGVFRLLGIPSIRSWNQDLQEPDTPGVDGWVYLPDGVFKVGFEIAGICPTEGRRGLPILETYNQPELLYAVTTASHGALLTSGVEGKVAAIA